MGKVKELSTAIEELRRCGETLIDVANHLNTLFSRDAEDEPRAAEQPAPKPIPLEKVRAVLADKSLQGKRKEVQALINRYGAERLSDIAPEHYARLLAEAEVL